MYIGILFLLKNIVVKQNSILFEKFFFNQNYSR